MLLLCFEFFLLFYWIIWWYPSRNYCVFRHPEVASGEKKIRLRDYSVGSWGRISVCLRLTWWFPPDGHQGRCGLLPWQSWRPGRWGTLPQAPRGSSWAFLLKVRQGILDTKSPKFALLLIIMEPCHNLSAFLELKQVKMIYELQIVRFVELKQVKMMSYKS